MCTKTGAARPVVCVPLDSYPDVDMARKMVICYECRQEQPGGAAAVQIYYDSLRSKA